MVIQFQALPSDDLLLLEMTLCFLTALIYGHSVRNSVGMSNIRKIIGVCPQVAFFLLLSVLTLFPSFSHFGSIHIGSQ